MASPNDSMDLEWADGSEDKQGLLTQDSSNQRWSLEEQKPKRKHQLHLIILYTTNLVLLAGLVWALFLKKDPSLAIYSPVNPIVSYKTTQYIAGLPGALTPYQGEPTPEKNKLWEDLYMGISASRIPKDEANQLLNITYELPDSDGDHVVSIEVFHQLHCLNILRRALWADHFPDRAWKGEDGKVRGNLIVHSDHCIDRIRQGLMCSANVGVSTWRRPPKSPVVGDTFEERLATDMKLTTTCRDFDRIKEWAQERRIEGWIDAH